MNFQAGDRIKLQSKTRAGKNKIVEHGADWIIVGELDRVTCLNDKAGFFIESTQDNDRRWIQQNNDPNFLITKAEG